MSQFAFQLIKAQTITRPTTSEIHSLPHSKEICGPIWPHFNRTTTSSYYNSEIKMRTSSPLGKGQLRNASGVLYFFSYATFINGLTVGDGPPTMC